jgi:hypothetical protein
MDLRTNDSLALDRDIRLPESMILGEKIHTWPHHHPLPNLNKPGAADIGESPDVTIIPQSQPLPRLIQKYIRGTDYGRSSNRTAVTQNDPSFGQTNNLATFLEIQPSPGSNIPGVVKPDSTVAENRPTR